MEPIYNTEDNFFASEEGINSEIFSLDAEISGNKAGHNQEEYSNFDFNELEFHKKKCAGILWTPAPIMLSIALTKSGK